jgi:GNAT superfamily N-acetyltransferase
MAASGLDQLPSLIGDDAVARFDQVIEFSKPLHHRDAPDDHWYVMVIGVAPVRQGQGLGRALLQPIMDRARADRLPCYLETTQAPNVPFYKKLGFEVISDTIEPQSGLRLWTFRRDPI